MKRIRPWLQPNAKSTLTLIWLLGTVPGLARAGAPVEAWVRHYSAGTNGYEYARAVAVDSHNNVIVAGYSYGDRGDGGYVTLKYSTAGVPLWTNVYRGGPSGRRPNAMAVDGSDSVIVVGENGTIKYSDAGIPLWSNANSGIAVAVDRSTNVIVAGMTAGSYSAADYQVIKYSSQGAPLWTNRYNGIGNDSDSPSAVVVDSSNNVIVTGNSYASRTYGSDDYATIKYSSAGVPLWTNRYSGPGGASDLANGLAVDSEDNVIVTGRGFDGRVWDFATIKYSAAGVPLWTQVYAGPAGIENAAVGIAVDSKNNVIVTGYSSGIDMDYATIKYSSAGVPLWTKRYDGPGHDLDWPAAVAVDRADNVIVTGRSSSTRNLDYALATITYSSAGVPLAVNRFDNPIVDDEAKALAVDKNNDVIVAGLTYRLAANPYLIVVKYASAAFPAILSQPASQTVNVGTTTTFSVAATGSEPLRYQWRRNEQNLSDGPEISGATTATLILTDLRTNHAGTYSVVVSNLYGQAVSSNALLQVNQPPCADASATASVVCSPDGVQAQVVLDGSRSSDPDADQLRFAWFQAGGTSPLASGVAAVVTLPLGTNRLVLAVDDGLATNRTDFAVAVITLVEGLDRLMARVEATVAKPKPLLATLSAARASLAGGRSGSAINQLEAFQNKLAAQVASDKPALAQALAQAAQQIVDVAAGTGRPARSRITSLDRVGQGKFRMQATGYPAIHLVEASTNLLQWEAIGVATNGGNGVLEFIDAAAAGDPLRMYRIRALVPGDPQ